MIVKIVSGDLGFPGLFLPRWSFEDIPFFSKLHWRRTRFWVKQWISRIVFLAHYVRTSRCTNSVSELFISKVKLIGRQEGFIFISWRFWQWLIFCSDIACKAFAVSTAGFLRERLCSTSTTSINVCRFASWAFLDSNERNFYKLRSCRRVM